MTFWYFQHALQVHSVGNWLYGAVLSAALISLCALFCAPLWQKRYPDRASQPAPNRATIRLLIAIISCAIGWWLMQSMHALSAPALSPAAPSGTPLSLPGVAHFQYRQLTDFARKALQASALGSLLLLANVALSALNLAGVMLRFTPYAPRPRSRWQLTPLAYCFASGVLLNAAIGLAVWGSFG